MVTEGLKDQDQRAHKSVLWRALRGRNGFSSAVFSARILHSIQQNKVPTLVSIDPNHAKL